MLRRQQVIPFLATTSSLARRSVLLFPSFAIPATRATKTSCVDDCTSSVTKNGFFLFNKNAGSALFDGSSSSSSFAPLLWNQHRACSSSLSGVTSKDNKPPPLAKVEAVQEEKTDKKSDKTPPADDDDSSVTAKHKLERELRTSGMMSFLQMEDNFKFERNFGGNYHKFEVSWCKDPFSPKAEDLASAVSALGSQLVKNDKSFLSRISSSNDAETASNEIVAAYFVHSYETKRQLPNVALDAVKDSLPAGTKILTLQLYMTGNEAQLRKLFTYMFAPRSLVDIVQERWIAALNSHSSSQDTPSAKDQRSSFRSFYEKSSSFMAMSPSCVHKTINRFVDPGGSTSYRGSPLKMVHGILSSDRVNIISGYSGVGKTTVATTSSVANEEVFSFVFTPTDMFDFLGPSPSKNSRIDSYRRFKEACNENSSSWFRDNLVSRLFVNAVLNTTMSSADREDVFRCPTSAAKASPSSIKVDKGASRSVPSANNLFSTNDLEAIRKVFDSDLSQIKQESSSSSSSSKKKIQIRFVLDEAGSCPEIVRGLCNSWSYCLKKYLAECLRVDSDMLYLYVVGTGTENPSKETGSWPDDFSICRIDSEVFFPHMLKSLMDQIESQNKKDENRHKTAFLSTLQDLLYDENGTKRPSTIQIFRFLQLVSSNARCAALAINCIDTFLQQDFCDTRSGKSRSSVHWSKETLRALLVTWSYVISSRFVKLNGLSHSPNPDAQIARALRHVMSNNHRDLSETDFAELVVKYGLLTDTASKWRTDTNKKRVPDGLDPGLPRYNVAEAFVTMFLLHRSVSDSSFVSSADYFEHVVADHHLLCLLLNPSLLDLHGTAPPIVKLFNSCQLKAGAKVSRQNLAAILSDGCSKEEGIKILDPQEPNVPSLEKFNKALLSQAELQQHPSVKIEQMSDKQLESLTWKTIVASGGAVVLVNAPKASFADVIVLTPGHLFLTQCKYYMSKTQLTPSEVEVEFHKMHTAGQNLLTRQLLVKCCATNNHPNVHVHASVVLFSQNSLKNSDSSILKKGIDHIDPHTNTRFIVDEHFMWAFDSSQTSGSGHSSFYPLLVSALDDKHLMTEHTPAIALQQVVVSVLEDKLK